MATLTAPRTDTPADRISDREFNAIRDLVYARFGITLGDHKKSLVVGRLQKVLPSADSARSSSTTTG